MELNQELVTKNMAREKQLEELEKKLRTLEAKVMLLFSISHSHS